MVNGPWLFFLGLLPFRLSYVNIVLVSTDYVLFDLLSRLDLALVHDPLKYYLDAF